MQNQDSSQRLREAMNSMDKLRSRGINISLVLSPVTFVDGFGYRTLDRKKVYPLVELFEKLGVSRFVTFAYEGGHQDHDLCNVIGSYASSILCLPIIHFSGYRSAGFSLTFSLMNPIVKLQRVKKRNFLLVKLSIILLLIYRKQWRTWVFLAFPLLLRYAFISWYQSGGYPSQDGTVKHFLYEIRGKADRQQVESQFKRFLSGEI
jgi:hypothetical protein